MKDKFSASWRSLLSATAILFWCGAGSANAQTQFTSITVFGESYADRGNLSCFTAKGFAN